MCVYLTQYPLVELWNGKRQVLFNYGVIIENRDFEPLNNLERSWNYAIKGRSFMHPNFNQAVHDYGIEKFIKYTAD